MQRVMEQQMNARRLTQETEHHQTVRILTEIAAIVKELFGKIRGCICQSAIYCDYGFHIEVGKNSLQIITAPFSMWQR